MPLSEGVSSTFSFKQYATGLITAGTLANSVSDLGTTGAKYLRRVSSTLDFARSNYGSNEIRSDRQIADFRLGPGSVTGSISGELSAATYFPFIEAVNRDTKTSALTITEATLTSAAASASGSTITFAGGDPLAAGLYVGMVIRFAGMSTAANNSVNFLITGMGGTSNRVLNVYPPPVDQAADTAFTLTAPGCTSIVPTTGHVSRKFAIEHNASDIDFSRLFTECRASTYKVTAPATGMITCEFGFQGRNMESYENTSAPFFQSVSAPTTTGICTSVDGLLLVNGVSIGVVTAVDFTMDLSPSPALVMGQDFAAEIFLGRAAVTGNLTAYLADGSLISHFVNEDELALALVFTATSATNSPFISFFFPRIKISSQTLQIQGESGQTLQMQFQALLAPGTVTGVKQSTILVHDSEAT